MKVKGNIPKNWDELVGMMDFIRGCTWEYLRWNDGEEVYQNYKSSMSRDEFISDIKKQIGDNEVVFLKNNFPYKKMLQKLPNVSQYILWSRKGRIENNEVEELIRQKFGDKRCCWMERTEEGKSVPEIWHCHVFVEEKA
jgi:hypothetical protein